MNKFKLSEIIDGYRAINTITASGEILPGMLAFKLEDSIQLLKPKCEAHDKARKQIIESEKSDEEKNKEYQTLLKTEHELSFQKFKREDFIEINIPSHFITLFKPFIE